jgi:hypothetical protein
MMIIKTIKKLMRRGQGTIRKARMRCDKNEEDKK